MKKSLGIALILLLACNKNSNQHSITVPDVIQAEKRRGNISGGIQLYDMDGKAIADASGATITIAQSNVSTQTNSTGKWTLDSIPFGTYDLAISKPGFGTSRITGLYHAAINHATTNVGSNRYLSMISTISITKVVVRKLSESAPEIAALIASGLIKEDGILFNPVFVNSSADDKAVRFFFSTSPDVSSTNFMVTEKQRFSGKETGSENDNFKLSWWIDNGFTPGQTIYLKAYGDARISDDYEDAVSGLTIFPSLSGNGSPVVSFVLPTK
ncbi:MAG: carboxypeptidase regulatory-like domain-containing protein [Chitinophagaceae bacterium]|nr:carboxypeptidase regulatory-like domain-containing protein [Chitinophagaceae bacterium]